MKSRYLPILVPILALTVLSGCSKLLKKKKTTEDDPSSGSSGTITTSGDFDAVNKADLARFPDERNIAAEIGFVRQLVTVRTAPNEGGTPVTVIDPDRPVTKFAERLNYTLVTFDRTGQLQKWAGWIPNEAFSSIAQLPGAAPTATAAASGTTAGVVATGTAKPVASTAGADAGIVAGGVALPDTGTCNLKLSSSGFAPSKASCSFDEKIRSSSATLTFPCAGGAGRASFSSHTFTGSASKTSVSLSRSNVFDFQGCKFTTTQTISGTPPSLRYFYSERINPGQGTKCNGMSTCTATASISANP